MHLFEIILFATIAVFFALRLYMMLGRRTGHEPRAAASKPAPAADRPEKHSAPVRPAFTGPAAAGMEAIRAADGVFDPQAFLDGARGAYELIVTAFANGDRAILRRLLDDRIYATFESAIEARERAGRRQVSDIVRILSAEMESAELRDGTAEATVRFEVELSNYQTDADGQVVDGDADRVGRVVELWTFAREAASPDPNWALVRVMRPS